MPAKVDPREYQLEFFREKGFVRKKCSVCGEYFWTLNPERETCGDAPCEDYRFWEIPRKVSSMDLREAIRRFLEFFRRHGHEVIEPRPVVARWRDDLYLTIASIVVFQPHVTSGVVPPPANPLVIAQPCIRLEDIDNVGLTLGRHLTSFTMGGHHAFNYPDKWVYWKDETVRLAFEFFTRDLGIPEDEIVFKESWWEGGGNAGPSFEVAVGGLELATLVFMQYKVVDGRYEPMELKVVDTGYGLERIAWFSNRDAPTAFHAIYGELLKRFLDKLGVSEPRDLLWVAARAAGRLDPEDPRSINSFYERVAREAGLSVEQAREELLRFARATALLDHTRTIMWMLGDGIVPSNSGEGYLARLVIRRAARLVTLLGADVSLEELVEEQLRYWRDLYPRYWERRDYILEVTRLEEDKFRRVLEAADRVVEKLLRKKRELAIDDLILLYDSHGIPPDIVASIAAKRGVKVTVPHDFYARVAEKHGAKGVLVKGVEEKAKLPSDVVAWASRYEPTRRLFHEDPYMRRFVARVLGVYKGRYVVLDATAFYPTGGGQLHDTGVLVCNGVEYKVVDVEKTPNDVIVHVIDRDMPSECIGRLVVGEIDWDRRYRMMRHHTATHVLLGAARRLLGPHVWQAGAEKTPEKGRLDITHYKPLTPEEVKKLEEMVNTVIRERRPVKTTSMEWNEAVERYGYTLFQGGAPISQNLRIVEVEGWDVEACFGTHLRNTGEIGAFKIIRVERIQEGVVRIEFVAGDLVAQHARTLEESVLKSAESMGVKSIDELVKRLPKIAEEYKRVRETLTTYRKLLAEMLASMAIKEGRAGITVLDLSDDELATQVLEKLEEKFEIGIVAWPVEKGYRITIASRKVDVSHAVELLRRIGGRGGGRRTLVSGIILERDKNKVLEALKEIAKQL